VLLILLSWAWNANRFRASFAGASEPAGEEKHYRKFMPGTKITMKPRKADYLLGENILLDYQISYDGEGGLAIDTATGIGTDSCLVVATDAAGKRVPASTLEFHCTGQAGGFVRRGAPWTYTIPLTYYCRIDKPGTYRVRVIHDLYWSTNALSGKTRPISKYDPLSAAKDDPRWAEATITVRMPDEAQARKVVDDMRRLPLDVEYYRHLGGVWETDDYADFACLAFPVYLPILAELAKDKRDGNRALMGIAHIPTPEATQTLLRLMASADQEGRRRITAALCDRLPDLPGVNRSERENPIQFLDADPKQVKASWRDDFAVPTRQIARKMLTAGDLRSIRAGAYVLGAIGTRDDTPALAATLSRLLFLFELAKSAKEFNPEAEDIRATCRALTRAIEALAQRGVTPTADPRTAGEIIHYMLTLKLSSGFRPGDWEQRCANWVRNGTPSARVFVLTNTPLPLSKSLVDTYRKEIRHVMATTPDELALRDTVQRAVEIEIPLDEVLQMLVQRLSGDAVYFYPDLCSCLESLVQAGKLDTKYFVCRPTPNEKGVAAVRDAWKKFLADEGPAIRNGKRFDRKSPEVRRLFEAGMID
jgi:hypothetical protein